MNWEAGKRLSHGSGSIEDGRRAGGGTVEGSSGREVASAGKMMVERGLAEEEESSVVADLETDGAGGGGGLCVETSEVGKMVADGEEDVCWARADVRMGNRPWLKGLLWLPMVSGRSCGCEDGLFGWNGMAGSREDDGICDEGGGAGSLGSELGTMEEMARRWRKGAGSSPEWSGEQGTAGWGGAGGGGS